MWIKPPNVVIYIYILIYQFCNCMDVLRISPIPTTVLQRWVTASSTPTSLRHATLRQEWAPAVGAKGQRSPGDEGDGWPRQFIGSGHKWPSQDDFETKTWFCLIIMYILYLGLWHAWHITPPACFGKLERFDLSHSNSKSLAVKLESYSTFIPKSSLTPGCTQRWSELNISMFSAFGG